MQLMERLGKGLREKGLTRTVASLFSYVADIYFDVRFGTSTVGWENLEDLDIDSANWNRAVGYEPTQVTPLRRLLRELQLPEGQVFLDIGCGKGRVLLVASE